MTVVNTGLFVLCIVILSYIRLFPIRGSLMLSWKWLLWILIFLKATGVVIAVFRALRLQVASSRLQWLPVGRLRLLSWFLQMKSVVSVEGVV